MLCMILLPEVALPDLLCMSDSASGCANRSIVAQGYCTVELVLHSIHDHSRLGKRSSVNDLMKAKQKC